jgi:hypothetical protein
VSVDQILAQLADGLPRHRSVPGQQPLEPRWLYGGGRVKHIEEIYLQTPGGVVHRALCGVPGGGPERPELPVCTTCARKAGL